MDRGRNTPFKGDACDLFLHTLAQCNLSRLYSSTKDVDNGAYANVFEVIQSSGTGKSRLVNEAAKAYSKYL